MSYLFSSADESQNVGIRILQSQVTLLQENSRQQELDSGEMEERVTLLENDVGTLEYLVIPLVQDVAGLKDDVIDVVDRMDSTTVINGDNLLDTSLIGNGSVSNDEFSYLEGVTSNIQEQIAYLDAYATANISFLLTSNENTMSRTHYIEPYEEGGMRVQSNLILGSGGLHLLSGNGILFDDSPSYSETQTRAFTESLRTKLVALPSLSSMFFLNQTFPVGPSSIVFNTAYDANNGYTVAVLPNAGVYSVSISVEAGPFKWFRTLKTRIGTYLTGETPSGSGTIYREWCGREFGPGNEAYNEDYTFYSQTCVFNLPANTNGFFIRTIYNFASSDTSGEVTVLKGRVTVTQIA